MSGAGQPGGGGGAGLLVGGLVEAGVVFCAIIGFFALMSVFGLFPQETAPLLLAVIASFGCYLYGRHGRRLFGRSPGGYSA